MREKIKHLIIQKIMEQGRLKMTLHNFEVSGSLTEEIQNTILDRIAEIEEEISKLKIILQQY